MDQHKTQQLGVRADTALVDRLDREAARQNRTRSNLIVHLLRQALERVEPAHAQ